MACMQALFLNVCACEVIFIFYLMFKLQMIPDDLLDQLNKLKYLERATSQIKELNDQVKCLHVIYPRLIIV